YPAPAGDGSVGQLGAHLLPPVVEAGAHLAALHLPVLIVGVGQTYPQFLEAGQGFPIFTPQVPAPLTHIDTRITVVLIVMISSARCGWAVLASRTRSFSKPAWGSRYSPRRSQRRGRISFRPSRGCSWSWS